MTNKEYGSDFHYCSERNWNLTDDQQSFFDKENFALFFSGRAALYNLLKQGISENGWENIYFPSYYCHEVVHFLKDLQVKLHYYEFNPFLDSEEKIISIKDESNNVIINVSFFGLKKITKRIFYKATIIDDLTHDILSLSDSKADYCFGSLRKELPLPVGGFCFSPKLKKIPKASTNIQAQNTAVQKLTGMFLKQQYIDGKINDKTSFRSFFAEAEKNFEAQFTRTALPEIIVPLLFKFNILLILETKKRNIELALFLLNDTSRCKFNFEKKQTGFGLTIECLSSIEQNNLKEYLIEKNIFPAILWPNQVFSKDIESSKKMLFVHMDYRYSELDIKYITSVINQYFTK